MKNTKKMLTVGSIATCGVLVGSVMLPTTASANGTSDAVITCDSAYAYDPENYQHPGFVCEWQAGCGRIKGLPLRAGP